jgi:hypothetical protein
VHLTAAPNLRVNLLSLSFFFFFFIKKTVVAFALRSLHQGAGYYNLLFTIIVHVR